MSGSVATDPSRRTIDPPTVVFDGHCVLCDRFVRTILAHERGPELHFATTTSARGRALAARHGLMAGDLDRTYLFVRDGRAWTRSAAWVEIMGYTRRPMRWVRALRVVPQPLRDAIYDRVARNRYRWFGRRESCLLPAPEHRHRFAPD